MRCHFGVRCNHVGKHRDQRTGSVDHPATLNLQINPAKIFAMRSRRQQQRVLDLDGLRYRVMGVACQDHIDARDRRGDLLVDVKAVMREQDDNLGTCLTRGVDIRLNLVGTNAEGPALDHMARIGNRRIGKMLADNSDIYPAALEEGGALEDLLVPFGIEHIAAKEGVSHLLDQLFHPVLAKGEFPVTDHGIRFQQFHG